VGFKKGTASQKYSKDNFNLITRFILAVMEIQTNRIYQSLKEIITLSRHRVYRMANSALLETYWQIGKIIVEDEQQGKAKAAYGKAILKNLATQLTLEFGKGFDDSNLRNMRAFYNAFPIRDTLRHELSWSHYCLLSRLDSEQKRNYYTTPHRGSRCFKAAWEQWNT
jgi:hypothetical protein